MRVPKDYWILIQLTCSLHLKVTTTYYIWWWYSGTCLAATSLLRPPHYHGHLVITATLLLQPPRYYGHLVITATSLLQPPRYYGHLVIMATLFWPEQKLSQLISYLRNPLNTDDPLIFQIFLTHCWLCRLTVFHLDLRNRPCWSKLHGCTAQFSSGCVNIPTKK